MPIQMVDLKSQYLKIKDEIDSALINCVESTRYIKGPEVKLFEENLAKYLDVNHVISCGNGTDALQKAAEYYYDNLNELDWLTLPHIATYANHSFNQFTLTIKKGKRDTLQEHLKQNGIPTIIYYPLPLYKQPAFQQYSPEGFKLKNTEMLCNSVLSIPMHTELTEEIQNKIIEAIKSFKC